MTADPSVYRPQVPAYWIATDQGVILAGPFSDRAETLQARQEVAERLRVAMVREHFPGRQIAQQVRAVDARWGVRIHPHGAFEARS